MQFITRNEKASFSLEGFLLSVKDRVTAASGNNGRKAKGGNATSSSFSDPKRCHVGLNPQFTYFTAVVFYFSSLAKMQRASTYYIQSTDQKGKIQKRVISVSDI